MKVVTAVLADFAQGGEGGKLNVIGIFDRIGSKAFPARHGSMTLVLRLLFTAEDSESTKNMSVKLMGPDGSEVLEITGEIKVGTVEAGEFGHSNQMIALQGISFERSGIYTFVVRIDDELVEEIPLRLIQAG